ncbi:MAG: hypothetical protein K2N34_00510 [Lachnospiraceae bacterium]|nr:hypothetical protein [Lachnospiraceae bacterium]
MGKLKYSKLKYLKKYTSTEAHGILTSFIDRYVDREKLKRYILMWNSFVYKPKCLPIEAVQDITLPHDKTVFFYDEREKLLYSTTMKDAVYFIKNLEPWDQVDACIFDKDMNWVIAVTHEDVILCLGDIDV